jgi:hypothetical protein
MGRAQGGQQPVSAASRRQETETSLRDLLDKAHSGDLEEPLSYLRRAVTASPQPGGVQVLLEAVSEVEAAQVRRDAEAEIRRRLTVMGLSADRTPGDQMALRARIARLVRAGIAERFQDGQGMDVVELRALATRVASGLVEDHFAQLAQRN